MDSTVVKTNQLASAMDPFASIGRTSALSARQDYLYGLPVTVACRSFCLLIKSRAQLVYCSCRVTVMTNITSVITLFKSVTPQRPKLGIESSVDPGASNGG